MCLCLRNTTVRARRLFPAPRARESFLFFLSFFLLSFLPFPPRHPPSLFFGAALLILAERGSRWGIVLVNGHRRRILYVAISLSTGHSRHIGHLSKSLRPTSLPSSPFIRFFSPALSSNLWKIIFVNRRCRPMFLILSRRRRLLSFEILYYRSMYIFPPSSFTLLFLSRVLYFFSHSSFAAKSFFLIV